MTEVLGRALVQAGHTVRSIGVYPEWYRAPEYEERDGVEVWRLQEKQHPLGWVHSRYELYKTVASWCRERAVDLIEVPDYQGWVAGWNRLTVPILARFHGSITYFANELSRPVEKKDFYLERASLSRADYLCSVSRYTAEKTKQLFQYSRDFNAIVYNPVELPKMPTEAKRVRNLVVFSGTLTPKKGVISLIKAWNSIADSCAGAELHLYGKDGRTESGGSMQSYLFSLVSEAHRARVHFRGHVSRETLFDVYRTASVAVFPSYAEAFAIAPLEAMACGCPTISSIRGSGPESMEAGREGLLVDPDDPESIAGAVQQILANENFASCLGEAGRRRVQETFSVERLVEKNIELYKYCITDFHQRCSSQ
jgi:glycosyltransferase involved in cell wall biosynthesis